jgi:3-oxoacyl-[acyl-carrier-protein] synthase III
VSLQNKPLQGVQLVGVGGAVPSTIIKNTDLETLVATTHEWIVTRTGIQERRVLSGEESLTDLCLQASEEALRSAGWADGKQLDLIIVATSTPEERYPATAARLQAALGATHAFGFDLALACTGFVAALMTAEQFLRTGACKTALVVGADAHSRVIDWSDRNTCILFGDGAGACLLQAVPAEEDAFLINDAHLDGGRAYDLHAANELGSCPLVPAPKARSTYVQMNGRDVFKFAVGEVPASIRSTLSQAGLKINELDWLVLHQANARIMQAMTEKLGIPLEKMVINLDRYGNTSAASIPLALNEASLDGRLKPGQTVLMCGFGGGLSWSSSLVRWNVVEQRKEAQLVMKSCKPEQAQEQALV